MISVIFIMFWLETEWSYFDAVEFGWNWEIFAFHHHLFGRVSGIGENSAVIRVCRRLTAAKKLANRVNAGLPESHGAMKRDASRNKTDCANGGMLRTFPAAQTCRREELEQQRNCTDRRSCHTMKICRTKNLGN